MKKIGNRQHVRGYYVFLRRRVVLINVDVIVDAMSMIFQIERQPAELYHVSRRCLNSPDALFIVGVNTIFDGRLNHLVRFFQQPAASFIRTTIQVLFR